MRVSRAQDFLGRLAEANPGLFLGLGRLETSWMADQLDRVALDRPVYITSLARAGTTLLLEALSRHPDIATHRYRDFPFVNIPAWWNWFVGQASSGAADAAERFHRDGLMVTSDSPEAMEEVLWMAFFPRCHDPLASNVLGAADQNPGFESFYRDHVRKLLLIRKRTRYLAKGNYNLSRLGYIGRMFPDARFIVPVRDPVTHVASMIRQHRLFGEEGKRDARVRNYMRRAGHFEFGLDFRPVNFGDAAVSSRVMDLLASGSEVRAWAAYWAAAFSFAAALLEANASLAGRVLVFGYERFLADPAATFRRVFGHCGLAADSNLLANSVQLVTGGKQYPLAFSERDIAVIGEETSHALSRISAFMAA